MDHNDPLLIFVAVMAIATALVLIGVVVGASFMEGLKLWFLWGFITLIYCWMGSGKPPWRW